MYLLILIYSCAVCFIVYLLILIYSCAVCFIVYLHILMMLHCSVYHFLHVYITSTRLSAYAVCCSVLHCVAVCCSVLQCVAVWCSVLQRVAACCSVLQRVAVQTLSMCSVFHRVHTYFCVHLQHLLNVYVYVSSEIHWYMTPLEYIYPWLLYHLFIYNISWMCMSMSPLKYIDIWHL